MKRISGMEIAHMTADECRESLRELERALPDLVEKRDLAQDQIGKNLRTRELVTARLIQVLENEVKHES